VLVTTTPWLRDGIGALLALEPDLEIWAAPETWARLSP